MRKLFWLGLAALLAFRGGKGLSQQPSAAPDIDRSSRRIGVTEILSLFLAPRWLRPVMLARAVVPALRRGRR